MSVFFLGCAHLGHRSIAKFRPFVKSTQENTDLIVEDWKKRINKRAIVYMMGDACFTDEALDIVSELPGQKILIKGNHDDLVSTKRQMEVFTEIHGMLRYKGFWLTHSPLHPDELRGKKNVHAHVHNATVIKKTWYGKNIIDPRYLNTCVDVIYPRYKSFFITLDEVKSRLNYK